ncbi:hypothetical protein CEXT_53831 [Caerostris extrusa]|uniref:Uncharacterized protein n=1 Tax=Caerostris extrusa TaxID=172846 RepID=A0AAV4TT06_CAEEX|nr:hypothetical protein CEXT_53831 [Caerostris extrusa]
MAKLKFEISLRFLYSDAKPISTDRQVYRFAACLPSLHRHRFHPKVHYETTWLSEVNTRQCKFPHSQPLAKLKFEISPRFLYSDAKPIPTAGQVYRFAASLHRHRFHPKSSLRDHVVV